MDRAVRARAIKGTKMCARERKMDRQVRSSIEKNLVALGKTANFRRAPNYHQNPLGFIGGGVALARHPTIHKDRHEGC